MAQFHLEGHSYSPSGTSCLVAVHQEPWTLPSEPFLSVKGGGEGPNL